MAFDEGLAERLQEYFRGSSVVNVERIYAWYQYIGYQATVNVTVDDLELVLHRLDTE